MKNVAAMVILGSAALIAAGALAATITAPPPWTFPITPPASGPAKEQQPEARSGQHAALTRSANDGWILTSRLAP